VGITTRSAAANVARLVSTAACPIECIDALLIITIKFKDL
jgi:hypothetical protein